MGTGEHRLKRLIVTADDFGRSLAVNEAVEEAHATGILTAASLMVGADAACDAIDRAKRHPGLGVGLHLVVICGKSVLPSAEIPDLVDAKGEFDTNLVRAGFRYFFLPKVRRQLAQEIRAQFEAFRDSGLELDHVNAHNHLHLHPTVLGMIISIGRDYGLRTVRVPNEPVEIPGATPLSISGRLYGAFLGIWLESMRKRLLGADVRINDYVFGIRDSGNMVRERLLLLLQDLPNGVTEIFLHPARGSWDGVEAAAAQYRFEDEFQALVDPAVKSAVTASGANLITFKDI
jgi:hopanoid biosynthesis associated protein HpnK